LVIAISNSGETAELKACITTLKKNQATIIAVTGKANSWLTQHSDHTLLAPVTQEGDVLNMPPRASIALEMLVLQGLSILLQEQNNVTQTMYQKWHPGGTLGAIRKENALQ